MDKKEICEIIAYAMRALKIHGTVRITYPVKDPMRITVYLDGEYFGVYNTYRNTFID